MKWEITYRNCATKEEYTLGGVEAADYNEACKIAKRYRGKGEEIAGVNLNEGSVFADILSTDWSFFERAAK